MKNLIFVFLLALAFVTGCATEPLRSVDPNEFPSQFHTGVLPKRANDAALCADALQAWGMILQGIPQPEKFGEGMAATGQRLGIIATPEKLLKYADEKLLEKK